MSAAFRPDPQPASRRGSRYLRTCQPGCDAADARHPANQHAHPRRWRIRSVRRSAFGLGDAVSRARADLRTRVAAEQDNAPVVPAPPRGVVQKEIPVIQRAARITCARKNSVQVGPPRGGGAGAEGVPGQDGVILARTDGPRGPGGRCRAASEDERADERHLATVGSCAAHLQPTSTTPRAGSAWTATSRRWIGPVSLLRAPACLLVRCGEPGDSKVRVRTHSRTARRAGLWVTGDADQHGPCGGADRQSRQGGFS